MLGLKIGARSPARIEQRFSKAKICFFAKLLKSKEIPLNNGEHHDIDEND